jgi:hypothetical protein
MKNRIRGIAVITLAVVVMFAAVSCGGSGLSGTYVHEDAELNTSITFGSNNSATVKVGADGVTSGGTDYEKTGTYTVTDNKVVISFDGNPMHLTIVDSKTLKTDSTGALLKKK